jgi:uncharacterized membrane protein
MEPPESLESVPESSRETSRTIYGELFDVVVTGLAIIVPFAVTLYVLDLVVGLISDAFQPFVAVLEYVGVVRYVQRVALIQFLLDLEVYSLVIGVLSEVIAVAVLLGLVLVVGSVGKSHYGSRVVEQVDEAIGAIPGFGTVYESVRTMGDVVQEGGAENFREVKLLEWREDVYVLAFVTNGSPHDVAEATAQEDILTVFVPFAPNPVTGGFLTYVSEDRLYDVDMGLEEGIKNVITSGVASETRDGSTPSAQESSTHS